MRKASSFAINAALLVLPFLLLEGAFQLLPVADLPRIMPVTGESPVARFEPNVDYRWSRDWNFSIVSRKRSNNYGFIHASDYYPAARSPLMVLIGDSLVEANQVDAGKSVAELLHAALGAEGRVYSLAISGAPLSQYLAYAEFARSRFRPVAMAFVIAPNDFDESLLKYKSERRFHYFAEDGTLRRIDYELSSAKRVLRQSAVLRYIMQNLQAGQRLPALWQSLRGAVPVSAESGEGLERRLAESYRAVEYFLDQLPGKSGLGRESILFVVDPLRPSIYAAEDWAQAKNGYHARISRFFVTQATARGYEVIDLHPVFTRKREVHGAGLEAGPTDSHWSALGHQVVAEELRKSAVFGRAFSRLARFRSVTARPAN